MKTLNDENIANLSKYFYKLAEQSQDIFWVRDKDFATVLYINPAYEEISCAFRMPYYYRGYYYNSVSIP